MLKWDHLIWHEAHWGILWQQAPAILPSLHTATPIFFTLQVLMLIRQALLLPTEPPPQVLLRFTLLYYRWSTSYLKYLGRVHVHWQRAWRVRPTSKHGMYIICLIPSASAVWPSPIPWRQMGKFFHPAHYQHARVLDIWRIFFELGIFKHISELGIFWFRHAQFGILPLLKSIREITWPPLGLSYISSMLLFSFSLWFVTVRDNLEPKGIGYH